MFTSFTLAIPTSKPYETALWFQEYLEIPRIQRMGNDVYELEIFENLWFQFYHSGACESDKFIFRFGVNDLDEIIKRQHSVYKIFPTYRVLPEIKYIYSVENPWGQKIGFYELSNKEEI